MSTLWKRYGVPPFPNTKRKKEHTVLKFIIKYKWVHNQVSTLFVICNTTSINASHAPFRNPLVTKLTQARVRSMYIEATPQCTEKQISNYHWRLDSSSSIGQSRVSLSGRSTMSRSCKHDLWWRLCIRISQNQPDQTDWNGYIRAVPRRKALIQEACNEKASCLIPKMRHTYIFICVPKCSDAK